MSDEHDDTDIPHLQYHEWCRANLPDGWVLHGSTLDAGCRAINSTTYNDFPHAALAEIEQLKARITALETAARAVIENVCFAAIRGNTYDERWGAIKFELLDELEKIVDEGT